MHGDLFLSIGISIISATILAFIAKHVKQPLIIAYILAGVIIGPQIGFGWIQTEEEIELISEIGLILLLFIIGLEIDLKKLIKAGKAVILTGLLQVPISFAIGWNLLSLFGFDHNSTRIELGYLAFAISISSTMIVVKLLYDKNELDTLPGRITLGVLIFQDIWAMIFLAIQPNLLNPHIWVIPQSFGKGIGLVMICLLLSKYVLPKFFHSVARVPELILVGSLAWCFLACGLAQFAGLSKEMGALIAGVSISTFPYNFEVIGKVINIRDFFITLFFVGLGMKIPFPDIEILALAIGISAILIFTRVFSVFPVLYLQKLGNRVSLIPTINLSQISEFSLVIGALGISYGHIGERIVSLIVFTLVITATLSTYMIEGSHSIFLAINKWLVKIGLKEPYQKEAEAEFEKKNIFMLGFYKIASSFSYEIEQRNSALKEQIRIIDFNPDVLRKLKKRGFDAQYGDIANIDNLHHLGISEAKVVISTIPDSILRGTNNMNILKSVKNLAPEAKVFVTSEDIKTALALYDAGADYVIMPRILTVYQLVPLIERASAWLKIGRATPNYSHLKERIEILG